MDAALVRITFLLDDRRRVVAGMIQRYGKRAVYGKGWGRIKLQFLSADHHLSCRRKSEIINLKS